MTGRGRRAFRVERERRRLRGVFGAALLAGAAAPAAQACTRDVAVAGVDAAAPEGSLPSGEAEAGVIADASVGSGDSGPADDGSSAIECGTVVDLDSPITDGPPADQLCGVVLPCGWQPPLAASGCEIFWGADGAPLGCFLFEQTGCAADAFSPPEAGPIHIACYCDIFANGGRRPRSLRALRGGNARDPLGGYLARMAAEEAASVHAFDQLADELTWLGAPAELVLAAARSVSDEERHARTVTALARRRGAEPALYVPGRRRARDLESIARHNAVEGCVRETYGALVACWQSTRAGDPDLRAAFARIAREETRHAALAWAIARWADTRLSDAGRRRVARARSRAVASLRRQLRRAPHHDLVRRAGLPLAQEAGALLGAMVDRLVLATGNHMHEQQ